uniref:OSJNBa0041M21.6 protein n=1 Tax=Oryza sativa subsp. japonica TaxID=39947 RepID=Q7XVT0_ORYSJ|nr:OSJNBa0093P23.1 [Oryza sativa Japonica Group]CAD40448.2 OSJNBa0041M21.6 [Oryza sativa Japonica Group]
MQILTNPVTESSTSYLDDHIIDAYVTCLREKDMKEGTGTRAEGMVFLEKPLITKLLQRDGEHYVSKDIIDRAMAKATANRYLKHDMIFLPMNIKEKHWYLAVIHAKRRIMQVLDSRANSSTQRKELRKVEDIKYFRRKLAAILGGAQKKDKKRN